MAAGNIFLRRKTGSCRSRRKCDTSWCRQRFQSLRSHRYRTLIDDHSHLADCWMDLFCRLVNLVLSANLDKLQEEIGSWTELRLSGAELVGTHALRNLQLVVILEHLHRR